MGIARKPSRPATVTRAVTIAVASPVAVPGVEIDSAATYRERQTALWRGLRSLLAAVWSETTSLANWAAQQLCAADVVRTPAMEKLPPWPRCYLYGLFQAYESRSWWTGSAASANAVFRAVQSDYKDHRFAQVWQRRERTLRYTYPYPYPVHNQCWSVRADEALGRNVVSFPLPGGRCEVVLRGGPEYRRQLGQLRQVLTGEARRGEMLLRRHRGTGQVLLTMVCHFPRRDPGDCSGVLRVKTLPDCFWLATQDGRDDHRWNADHVRCWVAQHARFLHRVSDDTKREKRAPRPMRRHIDQAVTDRCRKQHDRLDSWCQQATTQLAELARRRRVKTVEYDDGEQGYLESFPWHRLRGMLADKLDERSIDLVHTAASGEVVDDTTGDAREPQEEET